MFDMTKWTAHIEMGINKGGVVNTGHIYKSGDLSSRIRVTNYYCIRSLCSVECAFEPRGGL